MRTPEAYLKFAEECLRIAKLTSEEEHARALCDMSKLWMQEAVAAERAMNARRTFAGQVISRTKH